jgi:ADP-ribosylglycohydrolase
VDEDMTASDSQRARLARALDALEGLSVGDAFGERFFVNPSVVEGLIEARALPPPPWAYTDDTEMALGILEVVEAHGRIEQDLLAEVFARRYRRNRHRGYGGTAHEILQKISVGISWREAASEPFDGAGSMGNGGAMRVAPLGAWFAEDDDARIVEQARASAEVTHFNSEGQAGAIAIAVGAAWAARSRQKVADPVSLFEHVLTLTPPSTTWKRIRKAAGWSLDATPTSAARELGSGQRVLAEDTVPFAIWCAARHLDSYEDAMWTTVSGLGDRDTTCAIVGGIVAARLGAKAIPEDWRRAREPLQRRSST